MQYFIAASVVFVTAPSAEELIRAYERSSESFATVQFTLRFRDQYEGPTRLNGVTLREGTYTFKRDTGRWRIEFAGVSRSLDEEGRLVAVAEQYEVLIDPKGQYVHVNRDGASREINYVVAQLSGMTDKASLATLDYFTILFGFIGGNGDLTFADVLRESDATVTSDAGQWRLECVSRFGRATIWFDPKFDMQVDRLRFVKKENDLLDDTRIVDLPATRADDYRPAGNVSRFVTSLDVHEFSRVGERYYPSNITIVVSTDYTDGKRAITRYDAEMTNFRRFGFTDADFSVSSPIPDGYAVQVNDHPNLEYEWRNGEIVKAISAGARANLRASRFGSTFSIAGYFVSFAAVLLLVTALAVWLYRRGGVYR